MKVVVYTDGACSKNGKIGAEASWAFYYPENTSESESGRVVGEQTNQRGELMAIHNAVAKTVVISDPNDTEFTIYTDSMYSKNCLTNWVQGWINKNWMTSQGKAVCHRDLIEPTVKSLARFKSFNITYVAAHTGGSDEQSKNNDIVDRMATAVIAGEVKIVSSSTQHAIEGLPLMLMGPAVSDSTLIDWCRKNQDKLDMSALNAALISALTKTVKLRGFDLVKQRLHRSTMYKLISENHLIVNSSNIVKEE
jgi:ribonuclease HI